MTGARARDWMLAAVLAASVAALAPSLLTDGDSCTNAAIARDMAAGDWREWVAPRWAQGGAWTWYREHAPGSYWVSALLGRAGFAPDRAPIVAAALWMVAAAAGVASIVRRFRDDAAPWIAGAVLLLHIPALKYVGRVSIEFPLAACTAWAAAGALRLRDGRRWALVTAAALAGAFLVRGALGAVAAALVLAVLVDRTLRPPAWRGLMAVALAAVPVLAFDRLHAAVTGESFWWEYFRRQVSTSFVEGGTQHTGGERQFAYFAARLALYSLPWSLLPLWRVTRGPRGGPTAAAARTLLVGVGVSLVGASITMRPASRYLFGAWPCLAALFGLSLPLALPSARRGSVPAWANDAARAACLALTPLLVAGASAVGGRDRWADAARGLRDLRAQGTLPAEIRGPFDPQDARDKALLRWHLGVPALSGEPRPGTPTWVLARPGTLNGLHAPASSPLIETPFGTLHAR